MLLKTLTIASLFLITMYGETITIKDGKTYDFAEKDMVEEIGEHIVKNKDKIEAKINQAKLEAKEKIANYKPKMTKLLPAKKNKTFYPDISYTVPEDIKGADGRVMYPKGYKFNPADYIKMSKSLVIIDGTNNLQVNWAKKNKYLDDMSYTVLLSDGNPLQMQKIYKKPIYFADKKLTDKFKIEKTPSLVKQVGNQIEVREICLKNCQ